MQPYSYALSGFFFGEVSFGYYSYQRFSDLYVFAATCNLGNNNNKTREACSTGSTSDDSHASANTHKHMKSALFEFSSPMLFFFSGSSLVCLSPDSVLSFRAKQQSIERHFLLYSFFSSFSFCGACETEGGPFFFGVKKIKQRTSLLSNAAKRGVFSLVSFSVSDTQTFFFFIQKRFYR